MLSFGGSGQRQPVCQANQHIQADKNTAQEAAGQLKQREQRRDRLEQPVVGQKRGSGKQRGENKRPSGDLSGKPMGISKIIAYAENSGNAA